MADVSCSANHGDSWRETGGRWGAGRETDIARSSQWDGIQFSPHYMHVHHRWHLLTKGNKPRGSDTLVAEIGTLLWLILSTWIPVLGGRRKKKTCHTLPLMIYSLICHTDASSIHFCLISILRVLRCEAERLRGSGHLTDFHAPLY